MGKSPAWETYNSSHGRNSKFTKLENGDWDYRYSGKRSITALVDSRATGEFIDRQYAKSCQFDLIKLTQPIPVYNMDGSPNEAGSITEAISLLLHYKNHSEQTTFCVTNLG